MRILSIETSCDETSAAVVEKQGNSVVIRATSVASSSDLHALTGGIIPERAAREQIHYMQPILIQTLLESENKSFTNTAADFKIAHEILKNSIDAIAVTQGPGLIGSLLVGVETAKTISLVLNKPLIPVNHLLAHIYANFLVESEKLKAQSKKLDESLQPTPHNLLPSFPFIGLIVSGGHTDLLYYKKHGEFEWLGGTRDDAAGEALDKTGRILGLSYPAGPEIEQRARLAIMKNIVFSRPLIHSDDFDFSFSGLKTEVARFVQKQITLTPELINEICYGIQDAIADVLVKKTLKAAEQYTCQTVVLGGGVSANEYLRNKFLIPNLTFPIENVFFPEKKNTTDNAAMVGAYAALNDTPTAWQEIKARPDLYFD